MTLQLPTRRLALAGAFASFALVGCSSTKSDDSSNSNSKGDSENVDERMKKAQQALSTTSGYHVKLSSKDAPKSESSLVSGEGDATPKPSAFKGDVVIFALGSQLKANIVTTEQETWYRTGVQSKYSTIDLAKYGMPSPSKLFSPSEGLPSLLTESKDMKKSGEKLVGGKKVTVYKGTIDGTTAMNKMQFGRNRSNYTLEVALDGSDQPQQMVIGGPFYDSADTTYTIDFSKFDSKVTISKP